MRTTMLSIACLCTLSVFAQSRQDSIPNSPASFDVLKPSYNSVIKITAKEIENLPFTNIMEVINGAFPFVFGDPPSTSDYSFLVDGHLLINPNAINISQVAFIEFYPAAFNKANGSIGGRGTFVITTKKDSRSGLSLRSQAGIMIPGSESRPFLNPGFSAERRKAFFTHQELGYAINNNDLSLSSALSFTSNPMPSYTSNQFGAEKFDNTYRRVKLSSVVTYNASQKLKLLGGLMLNGDRDIADWSLRDITDEHYKKRVFHGSVHAGLQYQSPSVTNTFLVEYSSSINFSTADKYQFRPTPPNYIYEAEAEHTNRQIAFTNETKGKIGKGDALQIGWQLMLRFFERELESDIHTEMRLENGVPIGLSGQKFNRKGQSLAVMPRLSVGIAKQLVLSAGVTYDRWRDSYFHSKHTEDIFPYAGINWKLPQVPGALSSLTLHSTFDKGWQHINDYDWLDTYGYKVHDVASGVVGVPSFYIIPFEKKAAHTWVSGIDAGFAKERLIFSLNYLTGNSYPLLLAPALPGSPVPYLYMYSEVDRSGFSAALQATVGNDDRFSLRLKAITFYEKYKVRNQSIYFLQSVDGQIPNNDLPPQWRGSVQAHMNYRRFFLQAVGLVRLNETDDVYVPGGGFKRNTYSNNGITFLTLGYNVSLHNARLQELQLSIQVRNPGMMKEPVSEYYNRKYFGFGARLTI